MTPTCAQESRDGDPWKYQQLDCDIDSQFFTAHQSCQATQQVLYVLFTTLGRFTMIG